MDEKRRLEIADIIAHFNEAPSVTDEALNEYATRKGYAFLSAGEYQDFLFQVQSDRRAEAVYPAILAILSEYRDVPALSTEKQVQEIKQKNAILSNRIAAALEDHDIQAREVDTILEPLGGALGGILKMAKNSVDNVMSSVATKLVEEKYGSPLTVKAIGEGWRSQFQPEADK
jgi:hypothetical protein